MLDAKLDMTHKILLLYQFFLADVLVVATALTRAD